MYHLVKPQLNRKIKAVCAFKGGSDRAGGGSAAKSRYCSYRGPEFHPYHWLRHQGI